MRHQGEVLRTEERHTGPDDPEGPCTRFRAFDLDLLDVIAGVDALDGHVGQRAAELGEGHDVGIVGHARGRNRLQVEVVDQGEGCHGVARRIRPRQGQFQVVGMGDGQERGVGRPLRDGALPDQVVSGRFVAHHVHRALDVELPPAGLVVGAVAGHVGGGVDDQGLGQGGRRFGSRVGNLVLFEEEGDGAAHRGAGHGRPLEGGVQVVGVEGEGAHPLGHQVRLDAPVVRGAPTGEDRRGRRPGRGIERPHRDHVLDHTGVSYAVVLPIGPRGPVRRLGPGAGVVAVVARRLHHHQVPILDQVVAVLGYAVVLAEQGGVGVEDPAGGCGIPADDRPVGVIGKPGTVVVDAVGKVVHEGPGLEIVREHVGRGGHAGGVVVHRAVRGDGARHMGAVAGCCTAVHHREARAEFGVGKHNRVAYGHVDVGAGQVVGWRPHVIGIGQHGRLQIEGLLGRRRPVHVVNCRLRSQHRHRVHRDGGG